MMAFCINFGKSVRRPYRKTAFQTAETLQITAESNRFYQSQTRGFTPVILENESAKNKKPAILRHAFCVWEPANNSCGINDADERRAARIFVNTIARALRVCPCQSIYSKNVQECPSTIFNITKHWISIPALANGKRKILSSCTGV